MARQPKYLVDISGLSKAAVLAVLHNADCGGGMGLLHDLGRDMTESEAQTYIDSGLNDVGYSRANGHAGQGGSMYFDYVRGRRIKCDLSGDLLDPRRYEVEAGKGTVCGA